MSTLKDDKKPRLSTHGDGKPLISVPRVSTKEWRRIFENTGLCQAYDLESERPTPAGTPIFVIQSSRPEPKPVEEEPGTPPSKSSTPRSSVVELHVPQQQQKSREKIEVPTKPVFLIDDQTRTVVEETYTERHKYMVEMGFSAADVSASVPYVNASIKAEKSERQQAEMAVKRVFVTTREEFPRCRVDIAACLKSHYLGINPNFIKEIKQVTFKDLRRYENKRRKVVRLRKAISDLWAEKPLSQLKKQYGDLIPAVEKLTAGGTFEEPSRQKQLDGAATSEETKQPDESPESKPDMQHQEGPIHIKGEQPTSEVRPKKIATKRTEDKTSEPGAEDECPESPLDSALDKYRRRKKVAEKTPGPMFFKSFEQEERKDEASSDVNRSDAREHNEEEESFEDLVEFAGTIAGKLRAESKALEPWRERIIGQMQDIIKRYGAIWVETITLGAQHMSTRERKETWDSKKKETSTAVEAGLAASHAGATVGVKAKQENSSEESSQSKDISHTQSSNASGGDTIAFHENMDNEEWLQSIRRTENWRIISYRSMRLLSDIPGLEFIPTDEKDLSDKPISLRELLKARLEAVAKDVRDIEARKDPPRRTLGSDLKLDMIGYWYGFDCSWQQRGGFSLGPNILQVKINTGLEFAVVLAGKSKKTVARGFRFHGLGDDKQDGDFCGAGAFELEGYVLEVEASRIAHSPYRALASVKMIKKLVQTETLYTYTGHVDWTGMHGVWWRTSDGLPGAGARADRGTWSMAPVKFLPWDFIDEWWTFREREAHINEPRRRWLLPPDETLARAEITAGTNSFKRLDPRLVEGLWQGYLLERTTSDRLVVDHPVAGRSVFRLEESIQKLLSARRRTSRASFREGSEGAFVQQVAQWKGFRHPTYVELTVRKCDLIGGPFGRQRFEVWGTAREGSTRYKVQGFIQQVPSPHARGNLHDYPYLGKVDLTLTGGSLPGSPSVKKEYDGHLDHLGMHGCVIEKQFAGQSSKHRATFALMPVLGGERTGLALAISCFSCGMR